MADIVMPRLSDSMVEGKLLQWNVVAGETVRPGDTLAEVEADKANMEIEAQHDGIVTVLHARPGETIPVGAILAEMSPVDVPSAAPLQSTAPADNTAPAVPLVSPLIARTAAQHHIDLSQVKGTGPAGEVTMDDLTPLIAARQAGA